jgi:hypothetical protein
MMHSKFSLAQLTKRVRASIAEHDGELPKEQTLVWLGYFTALLERGIIDTDAFKSLMALLPDYPDDPVMRRMLGYDYLRSGGA